VGTLPLPRYHCSSTTTKNWIHPGSTRSEQPQGGHFRVPVLGGFFCRNQPLLFSPKTIKLRPVLVRACPENDTKKISHQKLCTSATAPLRVPRVRQNEIMFWPTQRCRQRRASTKLPLPPSWLPPPRCHRHASAAYVATVLPMPPTLRSCQAAPSAPKLTTAASAALLPSCRRRRQAGRCPRTVTALPPPPSSPLFPSSSSPLSSSPFPCF
jgi:hypothetical protein